MTIGDPYWMEVQKLEDKLAPKYGSRRLILFRGSLAEKGEEAAARQSFALTYSRIDTRPGDLVIARYSALPFYEELEDDILRMGGRLINTYKQHRFIADLEKWYEALKGLTPITWFRMDAVPFDDGPFVLKGETNSKKFMWKTHMFAENFHEAVKVMGRLQNDGVIGDQKIVIRKYVPLVKLIDGLNGLPVTKEFRFFVLDDEIVSGAYYWANYWDDLPEKPKVEEVPKSFLDLVIARLRGRARFYVVDVAQAETGEWLVIELNDGQMSGLSMNDAGTLYENMWLRLQYSEVDSNDWPRNLTDFQIKRVYETSDMLEGHEFEKLEAEIARRGLEVA